MDMRMIDPWKHQAAREQLERFIASLSDEEVIRYAKHPDQFFVRLEADGWTPAQIISCMNAG